MWGVKPSCVTALWLLFVWGYIKRGIFGDGSAVCLLGCCVPRTVHFGGVSSEEQREQCDVLGGCLLPSVG